MVKKKEMSGRWIVIDSDDHIFDYPDFVTALKHPGSRVSIMTDYNSNISMDEKLFFQNQLDKFGGDFDKLLEDIEKYAALSDVGDYETAAKIRDYRIEIKAPLSN